MHIHHHLLLPLLPVAFGGAGHFVTHSSPHPPGLTKRADCPTILTPGYQNPVIGSGWVAQLISTSLSSPRSVVLDGSGALLVLEQRKGITRLTFSDQGESSTCLVEESRETVVDDEDLNHGLALSSDGATLYASSRDEVYAWSYDGASGQVEGDRKTLVTGMSNGGHVTRTILLPGGDQEGKMVVSRGSEGNIDAQTREIGSGVSQLRVFDVSATGDATAEYADGDVLGWGLRNSVGLGQDPATGAIWSVENSADQMHRLGEDIHTDNPGEELNFHGFLNGSEAEGRNFGYPDCFALWGTENFPEQGDMTVGSQFAAEGSQKSDEECQETQGPRLTFQAHVAPLDVMITRGGDRDREMLITFHGSWNRDTPVGYALVSVELDQATGQPRASEDSREAARLVMSNADLENCPEECFRPVGLAEDSDGRIDMTSDSTGEIYVLRRVDFSATGSGGGDVEEGSDEEGEFVGGDEDDDSGAAAVSKDRGGFALAVGVSILVAFAVGGRVRL